MRYWTIQSKIIVESVLQGNYYFPDFRESLKTGILAEHPERFPLYEYLF